MLVPLNDDEPYHLGREQARTLLQFVDFFIISAV